MYCPGPFNSHSIICLINILPGYFFYLFVLTRKNWRGGDGLLFKVGILHGYYSNQLIMLLH